MKFYLINRSFISLFVLLLVLSCQSYFCSSLAQGQSSSSLSQQKLVIPPGKAFSDKQLQKDALIAIIPAAWFRVEREEGKKCKTYAIKDITVSVQPNNFQEGQNGVILADWQETWTLDICGYTVKVPIDFMVDSKRLGTTFSASFDDVKIINKP